MSKTFTVVRATCPGCGNVAIASLFCTVLVVDDSPRVAFTCPGCVEPLRIPCTVEIAKRLVAAGADSAVHWDAPPLTDEEVDRFCDLLAVDHLAGIAESETR